MDLEHWFVIPVPPEQAWQALLDVEQVAPCMPGATVDGFDGEVISGKIKIKVDQLRMNYAGKAHFTEKDEATKTVVLEASGKETQGSRNSRGHDSGPPCRTERPDPGAGPDDHDRDRASRLSSAGA